MIKKSSDATVLVVGAGPTGMVAALTLTAGGVPCRIIERRSGPSRTSRALGLQARSMELLDGFGIADQVEQVAYRLSGASMMTGDRELVRMPWIPPSSRFPYTYVLPQAGLEDLLRRRLAERGVRVETGAELTALTQDDSGVHARLADGQRLTADYLIGADGARSQVRAELGIDFPGDDTGETYYLADAVLDPGVSIGDSAMWLGPQGPLMLMRLPGEEGLWRFFADMTDTASTGALPELTEEVLVGLFRERGPTAARIERIDWTSIFHSRLRLAASYARGRAFLAGDAAHVFPPFGGQGMNLGIQDAVNLSWRIAAVTRGTPASLLAEYEAERRPVAVATIKDVDARRRMYAVRHPLVRRLRDLVLRLGGRSRSAAARGSLANSQLATTYRTGRKVLARGPQVGDRAPDAPYAGGRLHQQFGVDHCTLITFGAGGLERSHGHFRTVVVDAGTDPGGAVRRAYRRSTGYVLVRPDGYIASTGADVAAARARAEDLLGPVTVS
ncbi:FAD-dependent monooxygenase [Ruania zhangjianzhongii]|uniref:FAD-dependent monooxygenase n=1 Tax=Ruania zhangjianzhongii TaxID=2603206 RepID=UPI0011C882B2|nr:FAD-dependent monooxygenase [Ruania zhangjianzhongii]